MSTMRLSSTFRTQLLDPTAGKSWGEILANGVLYIYSGGMPASADAVETGTLLVIITESSGSFTFGVTTNGINFDTAADAAMSKAAAETWSGVGAATGEAGYGRWHENNGAVGASTTKARMDIDIGTANAVLTMSDTTITLSATTEISGGSISLPATITW